MNKNEIVKAFADIPTGNISDAMDDLGMRRQVITKLHPVDPSLPRMVGWAHTLSQHSRRPDTEKKYLVRQADVVDQEAQPGEVVVYACAGRDDVCTGGSILALRAKLRGLAGFLVDGCFRDVDEIADLKFPVYLRGTSPVRSKCDILTYETQCPVEICGVTIFPGDLIVSDPTGTVAIPAGLVEQVYRRSKEIFDNEAEFEKALRSGMSMHGFNEQQER